MSDSPDFTVSHFELRVRDVKQMERFYTEALGFIATDRSEGGNGMVFLSRSPDEHHQIVLSPGGDGTPGALDHIALRVDSLGALRSVFQRLGSRGGVDFETVSHGNSWSIYLRDPEGNRVEIFADTPWHVAQPVRFAIDLELPDEELLRTTEEAIRTRPQFGPVENWRRSHRHRFQKPD